MQERHTNQTYEPSPKARSFSSVLRKTDTHLVVRRVGLGSPGHFEGQEAGLGRFSGEDGGDAALDAVLPPQPHAHGAAQRILAALTQVSQPDAGRVCPAPSTYGPHRRGAQSADRTFAIQACFLTARPGCPEASSREDGILIALGQRCPY
jgi:hypothetical protein